MKKLLLFLLAGILGTSVNAQELRFETDLFKYIPEGAKVTLYDVDENGTLDAVWWDKNRDGIRQDEEIFLELNGDGIPDMPYPEFKNWYEEQLRNDYDEPPKEEYEEPLKEKYDESPKEEYEEPLKNRYDKPLRNEYDEQVSKEFKKVKISLYEKVKFNV